MKSRSSVSELDLRCFPERDESFRLAVQDAVARSRQTINDAHRLIDAVRADLASRYPAVVIHERDPLADLGADGARWYVYRDGRIA